MLTERESITEGKTRYLKRTTNLVSKKREAKTSHGRYIYIKFVEKFTNYLKKAVKQQKVGKPSNFAKGFRDLKGVSPLLLAHMALKETLNSLSSRSKRTHLAGRIGQRVQDEMNFLELKKTHPIWWKRLLPHINRRSNYRYKRSLAVRRANQDFGDTWKTDLGTHQRMEIGLSLLEIFRISSGLIEYDKQRVGKNKYAYYVIPTKATLEWIQEFNQKVALMLPFHLPHTEKPQDWTSTTSGGYEYPTDIDWYFIKTKRRELKATYDAADLEIPFLAANRLQRVPYRINPWVLSVEQGFHSKGYNHDEVVHSVSHWQTTVGITNDTLGYRLGQAKNYKKKIKAMPHLIRTHTLMSLANRFASKTIHFPVQADFRGRLYYVPKLLNPQGCDMARGFLEFANPTKVAGNEHWFLIGGANCYGIKGSLKDREEWALKTSKDIQKVARDPWTHRSFWEEAESPNVFLAWCKEFDEWSNNRIAFKTRLPVRLDHSASGLQIVALIKNDENLKRATNLLPSDVPNDVYSMILTIINNTLSTSTRPEDYVWLSLGLNRKVVKDLTLAYMYGGSYYGLERTLVDWYLHRGSDHFGRNIFLEVRKLLEVYLYALGELSKAPGEFLAECRASQKDELLSWTSPSNFPVTNLYPKRRKTRVRTTIENERLCAVTSVDDYSKLNKRAARNAVAANIVHSYDSGILHTVLAVEEWENIMTLHDCYGIPPKDCDRMQAAIKKALFSIWGVDTPKEALYVAS